MAKHAVDLPLYNREFMFLVAAVIGAVFNPWMIFYQQAASGTLFASEHLPSVYFGCDGGLAISDRFCDAAVDISVAPVDSDELNTYVDTGEVQNYNHGIRSLATHAYTSHPSLPALQYTVCQDTGVAGGVKTGDWRSLADADATQVAIAPGSDGVKVWFDLGQFGGWANYHVLMGTIKAVTVPALSMLLIQTPGARW